MPRIEIGKELVEIIDCPDCGRTVLAKSVPACGYLTLCGRRLINISEVGTASAKCGVGSMFPVSEALRIDPDAAP